MIKSCKYTVKEIANALSVKYEGNDEAIEGIGWNSREQYKNHCFFAIKGENFDGHNYINEAIQNGARLIISNEQISCNVPVLIVSDTRKALCELAKYHKGDTKIVGITGSVGKTSVKEMIKLVLSEKYKTIATVSNENNEIGVAKTLLSIKDEKFCVVEMGMRARGEIKYLAEICEPDTSIITNAGTAHIEKLGTQKEIFLAKTEILEYTKSYSVIPKEERFEKCDKKATYPIYIGDNGDYSIEKLSFTENGIIYSICEKGIEKGEIFIPSYSHYSAVNSLNAYAVGKIYSLEHCEIASALSKFKNTGLRENIAEFFGITVILDCYNASYEGMKAAIDGFTEFCRIRNLRPNLILGSMHEVGENEREYHYRIGEYAKDIGIKTLVGYGKNASYYTDGFCGGKMFDNKHLLAKYILNNYGKKDALLFKASRAERLEEIIDKMKELLK